MPWYSFTALWPDTRLRTLGLDRRRIDEWGDVPGRPIDLAGTWSGQPSNYLVSNCTM